MAISLSEFEKRLHATSRCQTVGITTIVTDSRIRKTNNPLAGKIRKVSIARGMINCCYDRLVNNQRLREGLPADFVSDEPFVGPRVAGTPLCERVAEGTGETCVYLEVWLQEIKSHYFCTDDGRELNYFDDVQPYLYRKSAAGRGSSQGTKKIIRSNTYRLKSVAELRIAGETWQIAPLIRELNHYLKPAPETAQQSAQQQYEGSVA